MDHLTRTHPREGGRRAREKVDDIQVGTFEKALGVGRKGGGGRLPRWGASTGTSGKRYKDCRTNPEIQRHQSAGGEDKKGEGGETKPNK